MKLYIKPETIIHILKFETEALLSGTLVVNEPSDATDIYADPTQPIYAPVTEALLEEE